MKRFRLLSFIILAPLLSYVACKKHTPDQPPAYLSYELKNYFDYKTGSYWVYKDSLQASTTDSFTVYNYTDDTTSIGGVSTETVTISIRAFTIGTGVGVVDSAEWDLILQQNNSILNYSALPPNGSQAISYAPFTQGIPFVLGGAAFSAPGCSGTTNYTINFLPYYTIDGITVDTNTYSNVYQIHYQSVASGCSLAALNDWMYLTQSFGIVKMNLNNSYLHKVLELDRYYIHR